MKLTDMKRHTIINLPPKSVTLFLSGETLKKDGSCAAAEASDLPQAHIILS